MKVLVVGGGTSSEREISLKSSQAVYGAALQAGHQAMLYDWDGTAEWLHHNAQQFDVVLPILHGEGGEDGVIQLILESLGVAYLGSNSATSKVCFDKQRTIEVLAQNDITTPKGHLVTFEHYQQDPLSAAPHVLKPFDSGSSVDTFIYPDVSQKDLGAIKHAFSRHQHMLLEEFITGFEITVPVLEEKELPVIEIIPPEGGVFDLENKYNGKTQELIPPKNVPEGVQDEANVLAKKIHQLLGCRHLSRTDMIVRGTKLYVLEVNTLPGMTSQSLFPKAAAYADMEFPEFVDHLIKLVSKER
jgi:D-alanine--D-alanine ligase